MDQIDSVKVRPASEQRPIMRIFLNRYGILLFNLLLLAILVSSIIDMAGMLLDPRDDFEALELTIEGLATIFIAYGVVLEERESLLKIFRYYPRFMSEQETRIDHICHDYGVLFLVIGLLAEVAVQLVKIPDRIFNTAKLEEILFGLGMALLIAGGYYTVSFCWKLATSCRKQSNCDSPAA
ncbi:MAG: hypothetical protein RIN56_06280 [Sporomusaceae bacterium]|nr:hypothetical protein [Sporomusaceae bacterium]